MLCCHRNSKAPPTTTAHHGYRMHVQVIHIGILQVQVIMSLLKLNIYRRKNGVCDQCGGVVYGAGLRVIRSINHTNFVKNLPFIFIVCSPMCWREARYRENFDLCNTQQNLTKNLIINNNSDCTQLIND